MRLLASWPRAGRDGDAVNPLGRCLELALIRIRTYAAGVTRERRRCRRRSNLRAQDRHPSSKT